MTDRRGIELRRIAVCFVLLSFLSTACGSAAPEIADTASAEPAQSTPDLSGEFDTVSGETIDLATYQGQDVVLWFWAPW